jgi:hypothetical protein
MTEEDRIKVQKFKREFEPKNLPDEIFERGTFVTGTNTNLP